MPGSPLIAVSTGNVMKRSTSTGLRPGACVSTSTWFGVTSGTASIGSRSIDADAGRHHHDREDEDEELVA